jgi:CTP synthase
MGATKYIFVTGGVTSSLGKGILAASLGKLLQSRGYSVTIQKFDPYLNIDPGTLNPYEHGECYVTDDGAETDLDLGHYERFLDTPTSQANNITTGRVYHNVMTKERQGEFLGKTIQVIPHITDEIQRNFELVAEKGLYDIIITEIGGCVGDIEALPFIEAIRQFKWGKKREDVMNIHLTLVPYLKSAGEIKTKPTQHSVRALSEAGIQPDVIVCRSEKKLGKDVREKISRFCNVETEAVVSAYDMKSIYDVPMELKTQKLDEITLKKLNLKSKNEADLEHWKAFLEKLKNPTQTVRIGLVGKYVQLPDAYKSIVESFIHAGAMNECKVELKWILSDNLLTDEDVRNELIGLSGVLVAPGFGERGIEGKIKSIKYLRENKIPFFGICLGMQCAVMEYGRNVLGLKNAASTEQNPNTEYPVIDLMEEQKKITDKGGTMRLGAYPCELKENTLARSIYGAKLIYERHRHRYEFNNKYLNEYEKGGMTASGINPDSGLVEVVEIKNHPFFIGTQYHPELKSTVRKPQPIFVAFVKAALDYMNKH